MSPGPGPVPSPRRRGPAPVPFLALCLAGALVTVTAMERVTRDWTHCQLNPGGGPTSPLHDMSFLKTMWRALTREQLPWTPFLLLIQALPFAGFALITALSRRRARRVVALVLWALLALILFLPHVDPADRYGCGQDPALLAFAFLTAIVSWPLAPALLLIPAAPRR